LRAGTEGVVTAWNSLRHWISTKPALGEVKRTLQVGRPRD